MESHISRTLGFPEHLGETLLLVVWIYVVLKFYVVYILFVVKKDTVFTLNCLKVYMLPFFLSS